MPLLASCRVFSRWSVPMTRWQRTASVTVDSDCAAGAAKGTGRGRSLKCGLPRKHLYRRIPASSCMVLCVMIAGNGLPHSYMSAHTSSGILLHLFAVDRNSVSPAGTYTYMSPKRVGNKVCISVSRHASASLLTLGAWECHQGGAGARRQFRNCAADVQL